MHVVPPSLLPPNASSSTNTVTDHARRSRTPAVYRLYALVSDPAGRSVSMDITLPKLLWMYGQSQPTRFSGVTKDVIKVTTAGLTPLLDNPQARCMVTHTSDQLVGSFERSELVANSQVAGLTATSWNVCVIPSDPWLCGLGTSDVKRQWGFDRKARIDCSAGGLVNAEAARR